MNQEHQLRADMLEYQEKVSPIITLFLKAWNDRLGHGFPVDKSLWHDLFGRQLKQMVEPILVAEGETEKGKVEIYIDLHVNEENPFQVLHVYRAELTPNDCEKKGELFLAGEEEALLEYCAEIGIN